MKQNNSNDTTANSKNSESDATRGNLRQDTANSNSNQDSKFTVCKTDANHKTIFEKEVNDINQAVAECCKCDSADKSYKAPHFENTAEDAKKASQWLSKNNSKYDFTIEASNTNASNKNSTSNVNEKSYDRSEVNS